MKVIFLKDVAKQGKKFEVKDISDGHAMNFLIPRGLALLANTANLQKIEALRSKEDTDKKVRTDLLLKNLQDIEGIRISMTEKANDKGHLFAGIHKEELVPVIKAQTSLDVFPECIMLDKPIKEIGEHTITVQAGDKSANFTLSVLAK